MMKYWLIVFFFTHDGDFVEKKEYPTMSKVECVDLAGRVAKAMVNESQLIELYCVTDDHYSGRKQDPGIPYD